MSYSTLPDTVRLQKTIEAVKAWHHGGAGRDQESALARLQTLIPAGSVVMTGGSVTLTQIGLGCAAHFRQSSLAQLQGGSAGRERSKQTICDATARNAGGYFLGSVNAIAETGELVFASATGSQLISLCLFEPQRNLGGRRTKITPSVDEALRRVREYVLQMESERQKNVGNKGGSFHRENPDFEREPAYLRRNLHLILVNEGARF